MGITTGWSKYKIITITPENASGTDINCLFHIHRTTGTSEGFHLYVGTNCKDNFADIRFYDPLTDTIYNHFIFDIIGDIARIWVKIPVMDHLVPFDLIVLYDNPNAQDISDPDNTFLLYDDFSSGVLDPVKWSVSNMNTSISDGILTCSPSVNTSPGGMIRSNQIFPHLTAIDVRCKSNVIGEFNSRMSYIGFSVLNTSDQHTLMYTIFTYTPTSSNARVSSRSTEGTSTKYYTQVTPDVYRLNTIDRALFGLDVYPDYNKALKVDITSNYTSTDKYVVISLLSYNLVAYPTKFDIDYIIVRKVLTVEPTFGEWSGERDATTLKIYPDEPTGVVGIESSLHCSTFKHISNITVYFGDGTTSTISGPTRSFNIYHIYDTPGTYTVTVSGTFVEYGKFVLAESLITISSQDIIAGFSISDPGEWRIWEEWVDYNNEMVTLSTSKSIRIVVSSSRLMALPERIKIRLSGPCKTGDISDAKLVITNASIVARDGNTSSGIGIPTPITFNNGNPGIIIDRDEDIPENPLYRIVESDWINFEITEDTDYLVIIDADVYKDGSSLAFVNAPVTNGISHITYISDTISHDTTDMVNPIIVEGLISLNMVYGRDISMLLNIVDYGLSSNQVVPKFSDYELGPIGYTSYALQLRVFRTNLYNWPNTWWGVDIHDNPDAGIAGESFAMLQADPTATYAGEYPNYSNFLANRPSNPEDRTYALVHIPGTPIYRGEKIFQGPYQSPRTHPYYGRSVRHVPNVQDQVTDGSRIRVRLVGSLTDSITIENAGISICKGRGWDYDYRQPADYETPITRIKFNNLNSVTIPPGGSVYSDWFDFTYDRTQIYTIVVDTTSTFSEYMRDMPYKDIIAYLGVPPYGTCYFPIPTFSLPKTYGYPSMLNIPYGTGFVPDMHLLIDKIQTISAPSHYNVIQFTDNSTGNPTEWRWDFGDGNTSLKQNPVHIYKDVGIYTVTLTVSNNGNTGSYSTTVSIPIVINPPTPICNPSNYNSIYPTFPHPISFTNLTTPLIMSLYRWDFGNGQVSVSTHPSTTYTQYGSYTVKLLATNPLGTKILTLANAFKFVPCHFRIIDERIIVHDTSSGILFTIINEFLGTVDKILGVSVCSEKIVIHNGDDPDSQGFDEYGTGHSIKWMDEYGNYIRSALTEAARYIIEWVKSKTDTDCKVIEQVAVCEETILIECNVEDDL